MASPRFLMVLGLMVGVAGFAGGAASQDPRDLIPKMVAEGASIRAGRHDAHGAYALVVVSLYSADGPGMARARQEATRVLGEYLGVEVSSNVESAYSETSDSEGRAAFRSHFRSQSSAKVHRAIAGMQALQTFGDGENLHMAFLLSTDGAVSSVRLSEVAKAKALEPGQFITVESLGVAPLRSGEEQAEVLAIAAAKQEALEMVMGVSMAGYSFAIRDEDEAKSKDVFRQAAFSTTSGCIERYVVISKGCGDGATFSVRIRADVSTGKLLDNYRKHLAAIGSPLFAVKSEGEVVLQSLAEQHFLDKGFNITRSSAVPDWSIELVPTYTKRQHPVRAETSGVQCALSVRVRNTASGELLAGVQTSGDASDFQAGGEERQRARCVTKAFRSAAPELERQLMDGIIRMAREGREVALSVVAPNQNALTSGALDDMQERWRALPGVRLTRLATEGGLVSLLLKTPLRSASLPALFMEDFSTIWPGHEARVELLSESRIDLRMVPLDVRQH